MIVHERRTRSYCLSYTVLYYDVRDIQTCHGNPGMLGNYAHAHASLSPRPFPRMRKNLKRGRRKGSGKPSRSSTGNGRNVGAVRMECNDMMCGSDMQNKLGAVSSPAIKKAVHYASDISGSVLSRRSR